jgi:hypothetical protein
MNFEPGPKRRRRSVFDEITLLAVARAQAISKKASRR